MNKRYLFLIGLIVLTPAGALVGAGETNPEAMTTFSTTPGHLPTQITVTISPPEAVAAGARWKFNTDTSWRESGVVYPNPPIGIYLLEFAPIDGWLTPEWDRAIVVQDQGTISVFITYQCQNLFPLKVSASRGGFVRRPRVGTRNDLSFELLASDDFKSSQWEQAVASSSLSMPMPPDNTSYRVQLWALAYPGYQFIGWRGDVTSMRNPMTVIMNRPLHLQADFARILGGDYDAVLAGDKYYSPGPLSLHGQINYQVGQQLRSLRWHPVLPSQWKLAGVNGLGHPQIQEGDVVFTGNLGFNPIQFELVIDVPPGQMGPKTIGGLVEFEIFGVTNTLIRAMTGLAQTPLTLTPVESPAPQLTLDYATGQSRLTIQGMVGKTYTIQLLPALGQPPSQNQPWWSLADLTLTNTCQSWTDNVSYFQGLNQGIYRAILLQ